MVTQRMKAAVKKIMLQGETSLLCCCVWRHTSVFQVWLCTFLQLAKVIYLRLDYGSNFTLTLHLMTTLRVKFTRVSSCQCESCHSPWTMYKKAKQKGGKNVNKEVVTIVFVESWILLIKQNKYTSKRDMQRWINMQSTHALCSCLQTVFVCALLSICLLLYLCAFMLIFGVKCFFDTFSVLQNNASIFTEY